MKKLTNSKILKMFIIMTFSLNFFSCGNDNSTSPSKSSAKQIITFNFNSFTPVIEGAIDQNTKIITLAVPFGTDITNLTPTITISSNATINPSSNIPQNFTNPVLYTVTAEDGSTATYTVKVIFNTNNPGTISGTISANTTLKDLGLAIDYIVSGPVYIDGNALLTIEPGTTIIFSSVNDYFQINENAGIRAIGTAEKPIVFAGPVNNNNKGSWDGIYIKSNRNDNKFEYVEIYRAGSYENGALNLENGAKLAMSNCKISASLHNGLYLNSDATLTLFDNNTIELCDGYPISCNDLTQTDKFNNTNIFLNNNKSSVDIRVGTIISNTFTLNKIDIPYDIYDIDVTNGTFNISNGVTLRFKNNGYLNVKDGGILNANGVTFTATSAVPGFWYSIEINNKYDNVLQNCIIEYCGMNDEGGIYTPDGKISLTDVKIQHSSSYGIVFSSENNLITHQNVTFSDCAKGNVFDYSTNEVLENLP